MNNKLEQEIKTLRIKIRIAELKGWPTENLHKLLYELQKMNVKSGK